MSFEVNSTSMGALQFVVEFLLLSHLPTVKVSRKMLVSVG